MGGFKFAPSAPFEGMKPSFLGKQKIACLKHQVCAILARTMGVFRLPTRPWRGEHADPHLPLPTAALTTAFLLASCSSGLLSAAPPDAPAAISIRPVVSAGHAHVERVIDGDTIVVRRVGPDGQEQREPVRLEGIDTPEVEGSPRGPECYGKQASDHMKDLLEPGAELYLEASTKDFDRYGRRLAFVYRAADGLFINHHLVKGGLAKAVDYGSGGEVTAELTTAQAGARAAKRGLWDTDNCP